MNEIIKSLREEMKELKRINVIKYGYRYIKEKSAVVSKSTKVALSLYWGW